MRVFFNKLFFLSMTWEEDERTQQVDNESIGRSFEKRKKKRRDERIRLIRWAFWFDLKWWNNWFTSKNDFLLVFNIDFTGFSRRDHFSHPLFPLLMMIFEKCELATFHLPISNDCLGSFSDDINAFLQQFNEKLTTENRDVDQMVKRTFSFSTNEIESICFFR